DHLAVPLVFGDPRDLRLGALLEPGKQLQVRPRDALLGPNQVRILEVELERVHDPAEVQRQPPNARIVGGDDWPSRSVVRLIEVAPPKDARLRAHRTPSGGITWISSW